MSKRTIPFKSLEYNKRQLFKLKNYNFTQLDVKSTEEIIQESANDYDLSKFFDMYENIFYEIPKNGALSHTTLIKDSSEYIDFVQNNAELELLQKEIGNLRIQLLNEQQKNIQSLSSNLSSSISNANNN